MASRNEIFLKSSVSPKKCSFLNIILIFLHEPRLDTSHRILKIQLLFSDTSCWPWVTSFVSPCRHQEVLHVAQVEMQLAACAAFLQVLQRQLVPVQNYTQTFLQSILVGIDSREPGKIITLPSSPSYPPACPVIRHPSFFVVTRFSCLCPRHPPPRPRAFFFFKQLLQETVAGALTHAWYTQCEYMQVNRRANRQVRHADEGR